MTESAAAEAKTPQAKTENEEKLHAELTHTLKYWNKRKKDVTDRVVEDKGSDWGLLGDLGVVYAWEPQRKGLEWWLETVQDGRYTVTQIIGFWEESVMQDLRNLRVGNSTSMAANLIRSEQLSVLQEMLRLLDGWKRELDRVKK